MDSEAKSRVESAVPRPDAAKQLSEKEKRAMELGDEAEHAHGKQREQATQEAAKAGGSAGSK